MNLTSVDLNLFVVFDTIYSERNLTRASEVLNITQPAVSNALARLRQAFGDPLFVRTGRTMTPTPAAQNAIGPVQQALRQLRASVDQFGKFDPLTSQRTFHICLREASTAVLMPDLVRALRTLAPGVKVHCYPLDRRQALVGARIGDRKRRQHREAERHESAPLMADRNSPYSSNAGRSGLSALILSVERKRNPAFDALIIPRSLKLSPAAIVSKPHCCSAFTVVSLDCGQRIQ